MTEKQERFADFYIQTGNASEAARQAGYSERTARVIGTENLQKPAVRKKIDERLKEMESERVADSQEVLEHLTAVLRGEIQETVVTNSGKRFVVPVSEKDRLKAADMLLKVCGAYREQVELKVDGAQLFVQTLEKMQRELETEAKSEVAS